MDRKQKRLRLTIIISATILWLTANMYYFWIKVAGGIFLVTGLIEIVCFLIVIAATIVLVYKTIRHSEWKMVKDEMDTYFDKTKVILPTLGQSVLHQLTKQLRGLRFLTWR